MPNLAQQSPPKEATSIEKLEQISLGKKKSLLPVIGKYLVWQLIALLCVEGVLAFAGLGEEELFAIDKELGMTHMTDKPVTWRKEGYARSYLNWDGLRESNITPAKPAGTYRIALLGDSMVEAMQVSLPETFGQKLEKTLTAKLGRPVQVINFGTSGYSTVQESLLMKRKVFKYAPDMVLVGYDARDMFENWSTPDQSLANVRPYALKLPGQKLVIDSGSVTSWMKTPRARFLTTIGWIRSHSRIWGLISAAETEAGFHNPVYATLMALCTQPGKTIKKLAQQSVDPKCWQDMFSGLVASIAPSFKFQFFAPPKAAPMKQLTETSELGPAISKDTNLKSLEKRPDAKAPEAIASGAKAADTKTAVIAPAKSTAKNDSTAPANAAAAAPAATGISAADAAANKKAASIFLNLMKNTLDGLLVDMQQDCQKHGAVLCVQALPSRAIISPIAGMDATTYDTDYKGEVRMLQDICTKDNIPFVDALKPATAYSKVQQEKLFYSAHLTPLGHDYLTEVLTPFLAGQIKAANK
jgi:hypothetical protein